MILAFLYAMTELLLLCACSYSLASLTAADEAEFRRAPWLNYQQVLSAYKAEYRAAELLGKNSPDNPNRLKFYPENRILEARTIVAFCLLTPDKANGYRSDSVSLKIMQLGFVHRRSLLAPTHRLLTSAEQLNCWNYAQESVCQPTRDCSDPRNTALQTVGFVTREGWGVFQLRASKDTQAHYQCVSEMQNVLTADTSRSMGLPEHRTETSDVVQLQVFTAGIGEPQLHLQAGYPRGQPLSANCLVPNSSPEGSSFGIELVLLRPPPPGIPGSSSFELLSSVKVLPSQASGQLKWNGEVALLSHHGLTVLCRVTGDWGERRGQRVVSGRLQVMYMFPVYLDNPRVRNEMAASRVNEKQVNYYKSPDVITLHRAEYVVCKADGHPAAQIEWRVSQSEAVWILNETLFISRAAQFGHFFLAVCRATNRQLNLSDAIEVKIRVTAGALSNRPGAPNSLYLALSLLTLLIHYLTLSVAV